MMYGHSHERIARTHREYQKSVRGNSEFRFSARGVPPIDEQALQIITPYQWRDD